MAAAEVEGGLWRPANMTEGDNFVRAWCRHCQHHGLAPAEDEFGNVFDETDCCICAVVMYGGQQPHQLVVRNGEPHCTAFTEDPERPMRCPFTLELSL